MAFNKTSNMYEGYIYCITNKVNGKKYIGQTTATIKKRMSQHFSKSKQRKYAIYLAIQKYGKENFIIEEIEKIESYNKEELIELLNDKEIYYIKKYHD